MGVTANTNQTYNSTNIREDLQDAYVSISSTECPVQAALGRKSISNTYYEWNTVDLANPAANRVKEGEAAPGNSAPTNSKRMGNYSTISDKVVDVSTTNDAVNGAGNVQTIARSTGTVDGANPTLSGTTAGFPNAAATDGSVRALTEAMLKGVIASCWDAGAEPSVVLCGSAVKQKISSTFTGSATKYQDMTGKKELVAAIDVYVSDFGTLTIMPSRFLETRTANSQTVAGRDVFVLDPEYAKVCFLQNMKQTPLAKTGHSDRRLIACEWGLQVDQESAHGIIADIDGSL